MSDERSRFKTEGPIGWLVGWPGWFRADPVGAALAVLVGSVVMVLGWCCLGGIASVLYP